MSEKPFLREIMLLAIGALISVTTAVATNLFNERREKAEKNVDKKLELNDQLSKDLGRRLFWTREAFRQAQLGDSAATKTAWAKYKETHEEWSLKIYSYESLLRYYYGPETEAEFIQSVFNPLVQYGRQVEVYIRKPQRSMDASLEKTYKDLRNTNIKFVTSIYKQVE